MAILLFVGEIAHLHCKARSAAHVSSGETLQKRLLDCRFFNKLFQSNQFNYC